MNPFFVVLQGTDILGLGKPFFILACEKQRVCYQTEVILLLVDIRTRTLTVQRRICNMPMDMTVGLNEEEERKFILDMLTDEARCTIRSVQEAEFEKTHNVYMGRECRLEECDRSFLRRLWCSGIPTTAQFDQIGAQSVCPDLEHFMASLMAFPRAKFINSPY